MIHVVAGGQKRSRNGGGGGVSDIPSYISSTIASDVVARDHLLTVM